MSPRSSIIQPDPQSNSESSPPNAPSTSTGPSTSAPVDTQEFYPKSESPVRKVRSLRDIYESCEFAFFTCEPQKYEEAAKEEI